MEMESSNLEILFNEENSCCEFFVEEGLIEREPDSFFGKQSFPLKQLSSHKSGQSRTTLETSFVTSSTLARFLGST